MFCLVYNKIFQDIKFRSDILNSYSDTYLALTFYLTSLLSEVNKSGPLVAFENKVLLKRGCLNFLVSSLTVIVTLILQRQRQGDCYEFKTTLGYSMRYRFKAKQNKRNAIGPSLCPGL